MREYGFLKMGINPKRQHYLPKFYLSGFTRDGLFWVYDEIKMNLENKLQSIQQ